MLKAGMFTRWSPNNGATSALKAEIVGVSAKYSRAPRRAQFYYFIRLTHLTLTFLLTLGLCLFSRASDAAGTWTQLAHQPPSSVELMLLMPDGTVMAANQPGAIGKAWYRLTPDSHGSYINGTWTNLASMNHTRLYYASDVLQDGRVFVAGAEYGQGTNSAEVYDPASNVWTMLPPPPAGQTLFYDNVSKTIANGNVLIAPVGPATSGGTVIFNVVSNNWIVGPRLVNSSYQDEASWVKLPDDSILTIDPFGTKSERYIPSLNKWVNDAVVPVSLYNNLGELGAGFLLADGRAFYLGGTPHTAFYTPSGTTNAGVWTAGPDIPSGYGVTDAAAAMLVNGKILCAVGSASSYDAPTYFFEFDPVANSFTQVNGPTGLTDNVAPYETMMLDLPDGTVLYSHFGRDLYVYRPAGSPLASGKPTITSVTQNGDGSYHLVGTKLNGISEGAAYGDDAQMDSNYPLVRLTDAATNVYYARTFKWSRTSVMTGNTPVSTEFVVPANLPPVNYNLVVTANGIASDPVAFSTGSLITSHPQSLTVYEGDSASFYVTASSTSNIFYQWRFGLNALPGATNSSLTLSNVALSQGGNYSVIVSNAAGGSAISSNALLTVIPTVPLPIALNATNVTWNTDGNTHWHGLTNVSHDGFAAGRSGAISNGQYSRFQTTVTGPGNLSFWWKVSSQTNSDFLTFSLDGAPHAAVSGELDWTQLSLDIIEGTHTFEWIYAKDGGGSGGQDAAWVDQVTYVNGGKVPTISSQPAPQSVLASRLATFSVAASGTAPLRYQWLANGAGISGATTNPLTLQAYQNNSGFYSVIVSNDYGSILSSNALLSVISVTAWGHNDFGQAAVPQTLTNAIAIAAGDYHSLALKSDGHVVAWGNNFNGQCTIPVAASNIVAIAGGGYHSLAVRADGSVVAWGDDSTGQTDVPARATNVIAVAAGEWHSLALRANGTIVGWGDNSSGQIDLPLGTSNIVAVTASGSHSLALGSNGTVIAWGDNLGQNGLYAGESDVPPGLTNMVRLAGGAFHSLALNSNGFFAAWGDDAQSQLTLPDGVSNLVAIAAGGTHSIALQADGTVVTWGDNIYGESTMGLVLPGATAVAAGAYHNLVLIGAPPAPLILSSPVRTAHTFTVSFPTISGKTYTLQYKNSLNNPSWNPVSSLMGNGGMRSLSDTSPIPASRFYRVSQSP
jgi:hypothetical protein